MKYKSKGLLLFAYGKEGELYTRKWDMKALTKNLSSNSEKEDFQEMFHTHDIDEKDLIDGKKFLENVRNRLITNDNGTLSHIFVDGYESNLGLISSDFSQGNFLLTENLFAELCEEYNIKAHWKNSVNEKLDTPIIYQTKKLVLFACGENGELYHVKPEDVQKSNNCDIEKEDLFDGKGFLEDVRNKCIIDYDGSLEHIFVNGFESNLGLASNDFCQGKFLVMEDVFEELCEEYNIKVDWAGR